MNDILEAKSSLEEILTADQKINYFDLLKQWMSYASPLSKTDFCNNLRQILTTPEQFQRHNRLLYAFLRKSYYNDIKDTDISCNTGTELVPFQVEDYIRYNIPTISTSSLPSDLEYRSAAAESFVPDTAFLKNRVAICAWQNGLDGAEDNVIGVLQKACNTFIENLVTGMLTRKRGYKLRNGHFQHGMGIPVPDPFIQSTNYIRDTSQEWKAEVSADDDSFVPTFRPTLDNAQEQTMFLRACAYDSPNNSNSSLDLNLLYHSLREDPSLLPHHSVYSLQMLKIVSALEE